MGRRVSYVYSSMDAQGQRGTGDSNEPDNFSEPGLSPMTRQQGTGGEPKSVMLRPMGEDFSPLRDGRK